MFLCFASALPCRSSAEISPEVIWRDRVRNKYICSVWNNRFIIKPRGWDFLTTPTRFEVWKVYFSFARISSALTPLASSFLCDLLFGNSAKSVRGALGLVFIAFNPWYNDSENFTLRSHYIDWYFFSLNRNALFPPSNSSHTCSRIPQLNKISELPVLKLFSNAPHL